MINFNAAMSSIEHIRKTKVDREEELLFCVNTITIKSENLFLTGGRGVGKSFLMKLLEDELTNHYKQILTIPLNMAGLLNWGTNAVRWEDELIKSFPRLVLLELCKQIWVNLFELDYSSLREEIANSTPTGSKPQKKIIRIFSLLMTEGREYHNKKMESLGFNISIKGEKSNTIDVNWKEKELLIFEFFEFVKEIQKDVLNKLGKKQIVIICDEANHLKEIIQNDLLQRYLELFGSFRIQFIFVASDEVAKENKYYQMAFPNVLRLEGFKSKDDLSKLISKAILSEDITIDEQALDILFNAFKGHPNKSLAAADFAIKYSQFRKSSRVDALCMSKACFDLIEQYEEKQQWLQKPI